MVGVYQLTHYNISEDLDLYRLWYDTFKTHIIYVLAELGHRINLGSLVSLEHAFWLA